MLTIKVATLFLVSWVLAFPTTTTTQQQPSHEISYIDSEVMGVLQEILEHKFDEINKKIDSLKTTDYRQPTTTPTPTPTTTTIAKFDEINKKIDSLNTTDNRQPTTTPTTTTIDNQQQPTTLDKWILIVFGITGIILVILTTICLVCLCCHWKRKKQSYSPNKMVTIRERPTNRDSWFPYMSG